MDCNQSFQHDETQSQSDEATLEAPKCNYTLSSTEDHPEIETETSDGCFDCNICLDSAHDAVVTLCGHLYCYSCIFEWLNVQTSSSEPFPIHKTCPVCKSNISHTSLVPLHGRGSSQAEQEEKRSRLDLCIPTNHLDSDDLNLNPTTAVDSYEYSPRNLGDAVGPTLRDPDQQVMIGELFYTRILWSFMGFFTDSFPVVGSRTPRMRRLEMQADKSLNRVSIFLLCCLILCLVTF